MVEKHATIMAMPVRVIVIDSNAQEYDIETTFTYLRHIDAIFSTYKQDSEISRINIGQLAPDSASEEVRKILNLCEETKKLTYGYFDMEREGRIDPSGIVKGYAIHQAAQELKKKGYKNFSVEIAGDVEVAGLNKEKTPWRVGIQNPFNTKEIVKVVGVTDCGVATSGNYKRGQHIYNPIEKKNADVIAALTVLGPNAYEADRFATPAFAMGEKGIEFIENYLGLEGYMITKDKRAIYTSGFNRFVIQ